ncbi:retrovirus-related Pol polyprotein from transposon 412 [Trichonephila clavipes]|uniref:RNA-directed DNA polymerase n=1 Tax=Trichonephila clavipes TaxID=2585209 RepID=A0A8X7BKG8_TRICX|nr:retrovirus-related Pol polyprotein from transposon 412 [Trichonephila clavipes]
MVNAVETRSQKKLTEESEQDLNMSEETIPESNEKNKESPDELDGILPLIQPEISESNLIKLSHKDFAKEQMNSAELKTLFEEAKSGSSKKNHYIVKNNLLFSQKEDKDGTKRKCLVAPEKYRKNLMTIGHEAAAAHLGVTKTKDAIFKTFYWPKCFSDVEDFVKTCDKCQRVGKPQDKKKAQLKIVPVITEIFTKINIDASGPLSMTPSGNKYIITALCMSSRYPDAIPVANLYSTTVINALLQIFSRMGFPRELQTDQGTSFMSALTTEFLERFGVKVVRSSVYHPQSNPVERMYRTLKRILRVLCLEAIPDWEKILPQALFALRTVIHDSTGFSPAELVHGKNLRTPVMLLYEKLTEEEHVESSVVDYVFELINRMKRCQELAILHMENAKQKQKLWYDRRTVKRQFQLGELVLVIAPSRPNKLSVQWVGPGEIVQQLSETNYVVKFPEKDKTHVYHVNMLKPYHQREENINLLCINPLKHDEEEDIPSLELENERPGWSKIISDVQLNSKLSQIQRGQLKELLYEYSNLFSNIPGCTDLAEHDIELESERAIVAKPYRMSPRQIEILKSEVNKMLELKIIEPGESDFTSPLILVEAQGKEARPCIDCRRLNKVTRTQFFPLPNIEELLEKVSAAKYISILDLTRGYWQIPLSPRAQRYASFVTTFGTFKPLRLPFGLKNAPYYFSRLMANLLRNCEDFAVPYLDDIAIFSLAWDYHLKHLKDVFERLRSAKLHIKPSKCQFAQAYVKYLGHLVGQGLRTPGELKVQVIKDFPIPTNKTQGRNRKLTVDWNTSCQNAFEELKTRLSKNPVLYSPDFTKPFIIQCGASNLGIGVVLSQVCENEEHPIMFLSKKLSLAEQKYSTTEKECAAIIFAVQKLKCYLDGHQKFVIQTDHNPLVWLEKNTGTIIQDS